MDSSRHHTESDNQRLHQRAATMLSRINLRDLYSTRNHSRDFSASRAESISIRVRILSIMFAVMALSWVPIDYLAMERDLFTSIFWMRLAFSASLIGLALWSALCRSMTAARIRLFLFTLIPLLFYLGSQYLFDPDAANGVMVGYAFLPYLMISLLGIFSLTFVEGFSYAVLIFSFYILSRLIHGDLVSVGSIEFIWLLFLLGGLAIWIQLSQLQMLLMLHREATRDFLTGLVNRRLLLAWLNDEISAAKRSQRPLSLMLFDLDFFKQINDKYGHQAGDEVLKAFAQLAEEHLKKGEHIGRYGGEEFLAILPDTTIDQAEDVAERIRIACEEMSITLCEEQSSIGCTTSIGVTQLRNNEDSHELIARVDEGLYSAKAGGRNLVTSIP